MSRLILAAAAVAAMLMSPALAKDYTAGSLKIDYDMGWATITSVTAADKLYQFFGGDSYFDAVAQYRDVFCTELHECA